MLMQVSFPFCYIFMYIIFRERVFYVFHFSRPPLKSWCIFSFRGKYKGTCGVTQDYQRPIGQLAHTHTHNDDRGPVCLYPTLMGE